MTHTLDEQTLSRARTQLKRLGFHDADLPLAELIPATEMAWADGVIHPDERALLEAYRDALVERLGGAVSAQQARAVLERLMSRRLAPYQRQAAIDALAVRSHGTADGAQMRERIVEWAEAVAAISGRPVWDTRELFWLQAMMRAFAA